MSCHTGEAVGAIQGWDPRAGTLTSPPSTPSLEVTRCRAGVCRQQAGASQGPACVGDSLPVFLSGWGWWTQTCLLQDPPP